MFFSVLAIFALAAEGPFVRERIELFQSRLRGISPEMTGDDLRRMGIPPGPLYRKILVRLRNARLDGEIATREQEQALVDRMMQTSPTAVNPPS